MSDEVDPTVLERRFLGLLAKIFSDGVITDAERTELHERAHGGQLSPEQVRSVMLHFLTTSMKHFTADGVITEREQAKLELIVKELDLPREVIPDEIRSALAAQSVRGA